MGRQAGPCKKIINDNGFVYLKEQFAELLFGEYDFIERWDNFSYNVKGVGGATMSELLTYVNPNRFAIMNNISIGCLAYLEVEGLPKYNYQHTGEKYLYICEKTKEIAAELVAGGIDDADLLVADYFFWDEIMPLANNKATSSSTNKESDNACASKEQKKSFHTELKECIVAIGELLGFESSSEVKVAEGAVVDAVWEAKIGNMGKCIYVFEVQSKGSIDSLILNLKKAQSNAAVQAVVAVSDEAQLEKILIESKGVIEEGALRIWEADDVIAVYEALVRAHESINNLALVPDSF